MITNTDLIAITIALAGSCFIMILQFNYIRKQNKLIYFLQNKKQQKPFGAPVLCPICPESPELTLTLTNDKIIL